MNNIGEASTIRNGVSATIGSPAALAAPTTAVVVSPPRIESTAIPPSCSPRASTSRASSSSLEGVFRRRCSGTVRRCRRGERRVDDRQTGQRRRQGDDEQGARTNSRHDDPLSIHAWVSRREPAPTVTGTRCRHEDNAPIIRRTYRRATLHGVPRGEYGDADRAGGLHRSIRRSVRTIWAADWLTSRAVVRLRV